MNPVCETPADDQLLSAVTKASLLFFSELFSFFFTFVLFLF